MHHHRSISLVHLFLFTVACSDWTPQPAAPLDTSTSSGAAPELTSTGGSTSWPGPFEWTPVPADLGQPDPTTTFGTGSEEHVATDTSSPPLIDLDALRITEVLADPAGKDGGASSPEFVEITNVGASALTLGGLVVASRSWPELWMGDLGIGNEALLPGDQLLLELPRRSVGRQRQRERLGRLCPEPG